MLGLRENFRLWALWIVLTPAILRLTPSLELGWIELAAIVGPLLVTAERRVRSELALAIGLPVLTLLWLFDDASREHVSRLLVSWGLFAVGVMLGMRTLRGLTALEELAGRVGYGIATHGSQRDFDVALEREMARARRHERPFCLLSLSPIVAPPALATGSADHALGLPLLRELAERRATLEVSQLLREELHPYAEITVADDRVLALIPEADARRAAAVIERLRNEAAHEFDFSLRIGSSCFPSDEVSAEALVESADRDRLSATALHPIAAPRRSDRAPRGGGGDESEEDSRLTPDLGR